MFSLRFSKLKVDIPLAAIRTTVKALVEEHKKGHEYQYKISYKNSSLSLACDKLGYN